MSVLTCNACNEKYGNEEDQRDHYRTEWHRYNLKRKVAGLPGVTAVWFERRREAAAAQSAAQTAPQERLLYKCTPCRKEYTSAKAHANHLQSKAHLGKVASVPGGAVSEPVVRAARVRPIPSGSEQEEGGTSSKALPSLPSKLGLGAPNLGGSSRGEGGLRREGKAKEGSSDARREEDGKRLAKDKGKGLAEEGGSKALAELEGSGSEDDDEDEDEEEGDWEEVSDEEEVVAMLAKGMDGLGSEEEGEDEMEEGKEGEDEEEEVEEWDVSKCCFCGKRAKGGNMAACVEHMHRKHGFFIPDAEYLAHPEEFLQYLALKVIKGHMCVYCDERGRQFDSVEAVRRHMVDRTHCKLRWGDGSGVAEEELEEFYDYSSSYGGAENMQVMLSQHGADAPVELAAGGLELVIRGTGEGRPEKVIGSREMARFYKQRPRPSEQRDSVLVGALVARYRSMGLATRQPEWVGKKGKRVDSGVKASQRAEAIRTRLGLKNNVIRNLPKNVTH